jgi:hypothetical protein
MHLLLYKLTALSQFYLSKHWLSKGAFFGQDHALFKELYSNVSSELDSVAEMALALNTEDCCLETLDVIKGSYSAFPLLKGVCSKNDAEAKTCALLLEEDVLKTVNALNTQYGSNIAVVNFLGNIAETHTRNNIYLLKRNLKCA